MSKSHSKKQRRLSMIKQQAKQNGVRHYKKIRAAAFIYCRGARRPVYLIGKSLVLPPGHHSLTTEEAVTTLGGKPCRCYQIFKQFQQTRCSNLPNQFLTPVREAAKLRLDRSNQRYMEMAAKRPKGDKHCLAELERTVQLLIKLKCNYAYLQNHWSRVYVENSYVDAVYCMQRWYGDGTALSARLTLALPLHWRSLVYSQGIAVIDKHLIVDVGKKRSRGVTPSDLESLNLRTALAIRCRRPLLVTYLREVPKKNGVLYELSSGLVHFGEGEYRISHARIEPCIA
jgi:hypothetical protein